MKITNIFANSSKASSLSTILQVKEFEFHHLKKTIIDCIDNIDLAGGIEEVLNALEQIKYVDKNKLIEILN